MHFKDWYFSHLLKYYTNFTFQNIYSMPQIYLLQNLLQFTQLIKSLVIVVEVEYSCSVIRILQKYVNSCNEFHWYVTIIMYCINSFTVGFCQLLISGTFSCSATVQLKHRSCGLHRPVALYTPENQSPDFGCSHTPDVGHLQRLLKHFYYQYIKYINIFI